MKQNINLSLLKGNDELSLLSFFYVVREQKRLKPLIYINILGESDRLKNNIRPLVNAFYIFAIQMWSLKTIFNNDFVILTKTISVTILNAVEYQ
jgi:hypothetical protein